MKIKKSNINIKFLKYLAYVLIFSLGVFFALKISIVREIAGILLIAFVLAYSLKPIQKILIKKGIKSKYAALLLIAGLVLGIITVFTVLIPSVVNESDNINNTLEDVAGYFKGLYHMLKPKGNNRIIYTVFKDFNSRINRYFLELLSKMVEVAVDFSENILSVFVIPVITYYFLCDRKYLKSKIVNFIPLKSRGIVKKIAKDADNILGKYILTQFSLSMLISVVTFIVLFFLKVKFPILLAILNGIFNIIPYFGPIFGAIPCILVALLTSGKTALYAAVWLYIIQLIEGDIISPKLIGESVSIHPVGVIIILIIGEKLGGFLGMVLAVPISVIIKVIYEDLNYYLF